jgi:type I restriction enzyme S subunit
MRQNKKLSVLRDWLLPMLMNGQVAVGYAEKEVEGLGLVAEGGIKYEKG